MFVLKNAWSALTHHLWRTICIVVVAALIVSASLFGLATRQANDTAHGTAYNSQQVSAVIRPTAATLATRNGADPSWTKHYLSWNDYTTYATAVQTAQLQFTYSFTESLPVRQSASFTAIPGSAKPNSDATGGEFTLRSFYTKDAAAANDLGTYKLIAGKQLNYTGQDKTGVLISQQAATRNKLTVGSELKVGDPSNASKSYTFKVLGIYAYTGDAPKGYGSDAKLAKDNRENAIYTSYYAFGSNGFESTTAKNWSVPDLNIMFQLSGVSDYNKFVKIVKAAKLRPTHTVSSPSLEAYHEKIAPLVALHTKTEMLLDIAWIVGALLLLALTVLTMRNRRGEISTALIVGATKPRIGWQLMLELLLPTLLGLAIGMLAGGFGTKPLGAALLSGSGLSNGTIAMNAGIVWKVLGLGLCASLALGIIASLRALLLRTDTLFEPREEVAR
jgi:cell division protein FtsX